MVEAPRAGWEPLLGRSSEAGRSISDRGRADFGDSRVGGSGRSWRGEASAVDLHRQTVDSRHHRGDGLLHRRHGPAAPLYVLFFIELLVARVDFSC